MSAAATRAAFLEGLRALGYVEGQTIAVAIEYRWADGRPDRLSALAAELVGLPVDVLVTTQGRRSLSRRLSERWSSHGSSSWS